MVTLEPTSSNNLPALKFYPPPKKAKTGKKGKKKDGNFDAYKVQKNHKTVDPGFNEQFRLESPETYLTFIYTIAEQYDTTAYENRLKRIEQHIRSLINDVIKDVYLSLIHI